jgi:hypothetical protein
VGRALIADRAIEAAVTANRVARTFLDMSGDWALPPLSGISMGPILMPDGRVRTAEGYDNATGLWCAKVPTLQMPERPTRADAEAALGLLRETFRTFPFADAARRRDTTLSVDVVTLGQPPGLDESTFLVALLTAVCRSHLWLAPALMVRAAAAAKDGP